MTRTVSTNLLIAVMLVAAGWELGLAAHTYWFAAGLTLVMVVHLGWDLRLPGRPSFFTEVLLFVPFALWARYHPQTTFTELAPVNWLFVFGFYSLALGAHHLLCSRGGGSRLQAFAAAVIAVALAGTSQPHPLFLPLLGVFIVAVLLELRRSQGLLILRPSWRQVVRYGTALILLMVLSNGVQYVVSVQLPALNHWLMRKMLENAGVRAGQLSHSTILGSLSRDWGDAVVLREWSRRPYEYLRAVAYSHYTDSRWDAVKDRPDLVSLVTDRARTYFDLSPGDSSPPPADGPVAMVYPDADFTDDFFLPLGTKHLWAFGDRVTVSDDLTVRSPQRQAAGGFGFTAPATDMSPPDEADLDVPDDIKPELEGLARKIQARQSAAPQHGRAWGPDIAPAATAPLSADAAVTGIEPRIARDAADNICDYFADEFTYKIGVQFHGPKDPVLEFLEDTKAGHCEYFASAAALLLRCQGIPTRYVTGFVCEEVSPSGDYRIARRQDAHAWVEMYVDGQGWVTFDPTPPGDRPPVVKLTGFQRWAERFSGWVSRAWSIMLVGGIFVVLSILWSAGMSLLAAIPIPVWLLIMVGGTAWTFRDRLRQLLGGAGREPATARVKAMRANLRRAERLLARHGLSRAPGMTVGALLTVAEAAPLPPATRDAALPLLREYQAARFRRHQEE